MIRRSALLLVLVVLLIFSGQALAQNYVPDPDVYAKIRACTQDVTLIGRIGYSPRRGGYYLENNPRYGFGNKEILNQNYQVLKKVARSGKMVTIRGKVSPTDIRARHLLITSIDGRRYQGRQAPLVRLP